MLRDSSGFPFPDTKFWVTLTIIKEGPLVTIQIPLICFQTLADPSPVSLLGFVFSPGGYVYTSAGFLPKEFRPTDLIPVSIVAASNNGMSPVFSFTQPPETLPQPPSGYIVQISHKGELKISCAGTFGNIIPVGSQNLMPCTISYVVQQKLKICKNLAISAANDITQFPPFSRAANDGYRDSHVNDSYQDTVAFTWTDNSTFVNKNNGAMNCMVAIGKIVNGKLRMNPPVNLTNFPDPVNTSPDTTNGIQAWDTAVAINRTNPLNIVVSWGQIDRSVTPITVLPYRAVSFDGGLTWPFNGPMNAPPTGTPAQFGDCRGVASDQFGNIWYSATNRYDNSGNFINQPYFAVSVNGGVDYNYVFQAPLTPPFIPGTTEYDYPQYSFGGDGLGNYGLWTSFTMAIPFSDQSAVVGFLPINYLGSFGTVNFTYPLQSLNAVQTTLNTASEDGRVWIGGIPSAFPFSFISPTTFLFKSPGQLDENYAGPFQNAMVNNITSLYGVTNSISYPGLGYFTSESINSILYDDKRQALYALVNSLIPDYFDITQTSQPDASQNMDIFLIISRDNGLTWSNPIAISSTDSANRGFQSMSLNRKFENKEGGSTGDLLFGWYDGRDDPTYQSVKYTISLIPAKKLNKLVNSIPLSDPTFQIPPASIPFATSNATSKAKNIGFNVTDEQKVIITNKLKEIRNKRRLRL